MEPQSQLVDYQGIQVTYVPTYLYLRRHSAGIANGSSVTISVDDVSWVPSPGVAVCIAYAAQAKHARFESAGASALHTPSILVLVHVTRRGRKG